VKNLTHGEIKAGEKSWIAWIKADKMFRGKLTLDGSNSNGCGQRLGPDQNGAPEEVI